MKITCDCDTGFGCSPVVFRNHIEASTHSGISCEGLHCYPIIRSNIIELNRKAGIKLMNGARAHIGGSAAGGSKSDLKMNSTQNLNETK